MTSELADLIFSTNSTLFKTLSELEVTDLLLIKATVDQNTADLIDLKTQVDSLGVTLFNYQSATNANFATVNTQLLDLETTTNQLEAQMLVLSTKVDELESVVGQDHGLVEQLNSQVQILTSQMATQTNKMVSWYDIARTRTLIQSGTPYQLCASPSTHQNTWFITPASADPYIKYNVGFNVTMSNHINPAFVAIMLLDPIGTVNEIHSYGITNVRCTCYYTIVSTGKSHQIDDVWVLNVGP